MQGVDIHKNINIRVVLKENFHINTIGCLMKRRYLFFIIKRKKILYYSYCNFNNCAIYNI
ncbi:MAG: hypothetical protein A4E52_00005 [Pelotomaculum sp. PtaB.Bin013]|nr:MAG: hypothetical protein A4E52_00005 [Pelotomaculum sp. PtaB.Bin013]